MVRISSAKRHSIGGFTLSETILATGIAMLAMAAATALNSAHLRLVKSSRQSNAATLALQERVEQMRLANWRKITDPEYLKDTLLASAPSSAAPLHQMTERITISAFPDPSAAQRLVVERRSSGERVTLVSGEGLSTQRLAQLEFQLGWLGADQRPRLRATTTVVSNGGVSRMNLPGFGPAGGAPTSGTSATPATAVTPAPSGTPAPSATPAPTPDPSGNGNGRGNVGGKSGKK